MNDKNKTLSALGLAGIAVLADNLQSLKRDIDATYSGKLDKEQTKRKKQNRRANRNARLARRRNKKNDSQRKMPDL